MSNLRHLNSLAGGPMGIRILRVLASEPPGAASGARDIADRLGSSAPAVAPRLPRLVRVGLVSRHWGEGGRRSYTITDAGLLHLSSLTSSEGRLRVTRPIS
jgi:DNA-binding MarR family transcriptional regulator